MMRRIVLTYIFRSVIGIWGAMAQNTLNPVSYTHLLFKIASGASDYDYNWTKVLMDRVGGRMHGLSLHYYTCLLYTSGFKELGGWDEMMRICGAVTVNDYGNTMTELIRSNNCLLYTSRCV